MRRRVRTERRTRTSRHGAVTERVEYGLSLTEAETSGLAAMTPSARRGPVQPCSSPLTPAS
ncbi:hypothetical protein AB0L59_02005 [Streptomyces sp. NPDC052109]|uniref:hypothetical protein n=1 Tax=Streptomyces sp. NPDC052109 TaxID=3155527 RepID=UPI003426850C